MTTKDSDEVKGSAFGVCGMRTLLSLLPQEAGTLCYDKKTPKFEGVALEFNPEPVMWGAMITLEGLTEAASDYPAFIRKRDESFGEHYWNGLYYGFCRAHVVDDLLVNAISDGSPTKQIVFCGVGQDYRAMRYGEEIHKQGVKVFDLDLPAMMALREKIKARICQVNDGLVLPETYALPIDFGEQSISEVLLACPGFNPELPTLYLWEGVTYYLLPDAMRSFLHDIHDLMCRAPSEVWQHHAIFFDHLIDLPSLKDDPSAVRILEYFSKTEPLRSFLDFDDVEPYLTSLGFRVHQQLLPPDMYRPYQTAANEEFHLKVSKYFGMVVAKPAARNT